MVPDPIRDMSPNDAPAPERRSRHLVVDGTAWTIVRQDEPGAESGLWLHSASGEVLFYATSDAEARTADDLSSLTFEQAIVMVQAARTRAGGG